MKKFLSILLAVMMVLSTVSFAAPSLAGTADTAVEVPVVEVPADDAAELAADSTVDEFGTLLAEVNFNSAELGTIDFGSGLLASALGAKVTADCNATASTLKVTNGSGANYPALTAVIKERATGDKYLEVTTNAEASNNLIQVYTGSSSVYYTTEDGYLTVTFDAFYGDSAANGEYFNVVYNRSQAAEAHDQYEISTVVENGGWGKIISSFDEEIGLAGNGGNSATMLPYEVNYIKIHSASGVVPGETFGIDNIRIYWRPKTVNVTLYVDGVNDVALNGYDTLGMSLDELAAMLPAVEGKVLTGFSLEKDGEPVATTKFASDCTVYPVYEERVALNGSLEFDTAADINTLTKRAGSNNALGANYITHDADNGYLKATFTATDTTMVVQDTGINLSGINFPAGVLTNIEIRARHTGMPTADTTLNQATGGTRNYKVASVNFPQLYFTTGGAFSTYGEKIVSDFTDVNGNWVVYNYTVEELGITDLTTFRFDFYDFMPHGSTLEIDYIRFIGKPVRVTVDNGENTTAPEVVMDITSATTVAEVEAKFAKDHGDMKFVGLARTEGGAVLDSSELVSASGAPTTLYAVWDDYEYLTNYSINFDADDEGWYSVQQQCNDGSTYWTEDGVLTIKSTAPAGFTASRDHYLSVLTVEGDNKLPAGVVTEIAVRMRYRNIAGKAGDYTSNRNGGTTEKFNPENTAAFVHIWDYNGTIKSNNRQETNLVDGEWFTRYFDAETYFPNGISKFRFDTTYPLPDGVEVDYDYVRFIGDNQDDRIPGGDFTGVYGEKVFTVDFDAASNGELAKSTYLNALGVEVNGWLSKATAEQIRFSHGANGGVTAPAVSVAGTADNKYLTYTLNAAGSYNYFFFNAGSANQFVNKDGYYIATFDYKSDVEVPFTFRFNERDLVEDAVDNIQIIENGEWDKAVVYYDTQIGSSRPSNGNYIGSISEVNCVKWHPTGAGAEIGTTVCIDNFTLWFVPKTTKVTVDLSKYGVDNAVIKDYPTTGMSREQLTNALPAVPDREITGLSLTSGGEALYQNRVATEMTVYPVYDKVKLLDQTLEFNTYSDLEFVYGDRIARLGKNNAKTTIAEQFVLGSDDTASYLVMENESLDGADGVVVDYGFIVTQTPFTKEEVKEIVIRYRIKNVPTETKKYTCGTHCANGHNFNPTNCHYMELVWWDANSSGVKQDYIAGDITAIEGEWVTYSIPAANFPYDEVMQFRFDPFADYAPHGTIFEVDYVRFYGHPEPDAPENVALAYSAEFNENANGVSLNAWKKADGSYMFDDGVNGDKGPGIGSKYITDGAEGYITWNEDGYVTLNFDANNEIIGDASDRGYTPAVYDPSIYVSALDKSKYIPAGAFEELVIRMRIRGLPADGTEIYGQNYGGLTSATFNMATYPVYFHWMNSRDAVLYDGVQSKHFDETCTFTEGSYVRDEWFEVTIPASFFEADVEDLATLRINLPDWTPDGTKIDIDYIRFMGQPPEVDAPVTDTDATFRAATATKSNAIRFKATTDSASAAAASDIAWIVTTAEYLEGAGIAYADLDLAVAEAAGNKAQVGYNKLDGEEQTRWFNSEDDNALVFAAALYGVPASKALETVIVRPVVVANGTALYGDVLQTSLYKVAIEPYIYFTGDGCETMKQLVEEGWTYDDAIGYDFDYNEEYSALDEAQQTYIEETLIGLLG